MSDLARVAGYELNFKEVSREEMIELSSLAFRNGHEEYINMVKKISRPISEHKQMDFIISIGLNSEYHNNKKTLEVINKNIAKYRNDLEPKRGKIKLSIKIMKGDF